VSGPVWTFTTTKGPAFPTSFSLEAALGGSFRGQLVSEANNVATWPLSDGVQAGARAHEIHERAVGTWVGSGFTPGVPFESIPEGVLGSTLNGNGFVEVPHMTDPNLSLAGGDIDIAVLLRDVAIDGVERCIVSKQDGGVTGNGYHLSVRSGQIKFYVKIGGAEIVNLTSAFVLGAGERIVTAHYLTQDREAVIAIDGVVDVRVSGLSGAEPQATSAPLRLGAFPGGAANDGASFIGTIAYVAIGREGDWHWGAKLAATRVWTDIWEDVRTLPGPIATRVGIPGSTPSDRVATTGTLTFPLDNSSRRSGRGAYTPGHVGVRRGWKIGIPIRFSIVFEGVRYVEFHGRLAEVRPLPGIHQAQYAECMVTDWMDVAAATPVLAPPIQIDQRSDRVLAAVLAQAQGRTPLSIDLHVGKATFPYALDKGDSEHEMLLTEIGRVVESEGGYLYIRGDTARGGVLRFESQGERDQAPVLVRIGNTMQGLDVSYSLERLVNIVRLSYTPRRVDTTVRPLYQLTTHTEAEPIESGETRVFEGGYVDPANEAESIGGIEMVPLVPDVDYGMNTRADGTGTNLTASLQIFYTLGGNSFRVELTNKSGQDAFLYVTPSVSLQVRGKAVYTYNETTIEKRDPASVRERGPRTLAITLPYDSAPSRIEAYAEYLLALYRQEVPMPSSVTINGNVNATQMRYCLQLQPGDKLALAEPMTGLTLLPTFIVCEKRLSYQAPAFVTVTLTLARARPVQTLTPARVGAMRLNAARLNYLFSLTRGKVVPDALESSLAEQLSR
jgi:hypothetical protein